MNKLLFVASVIFLLAIWRTRDVFSGAGAAPATGPAAVPAAATLGKTAGSRIVRGAEGLLASLDGALKDKVRFEYSDRERFNWHFIPRERKGAAIKELNEAQRKNVEELLAASLSEVGVHTVHQVRGLEEILKVLEGPNNKILRDPDVYYVSVFGKPGREGAWGWRFEGHHISLNFTLDGERLISATPLFFGANPSIVRDGPKKGLRVLAGVEDRARELLASFGDEQRRKALGENQEKKEKPEEWEVQGATSERYTGPLPQGLPASGLNENQKKQFAALLQEYLQQLPEDVAAQLSHEIQAGGLEKIQIAWRGSFKPYEPHSYIIHNPSFLISYANFQNGAAHVHSGFRWLKGEFGLASADGK